MTPKPIYFHQLGDELFITEPNSLWQYNERMTTRTIVYRPVMPDWVLKVARKKDYSRSSRLSIPTWVWNATRGHKSIPNQITHSENVENQSTPFRGFLAQDGFFQIIASLPDKNDGKQESNHHNAAMLALRSASHFTLTCEARNRSWLTASTCLLSNCILVASRGWKRTEVTYLFGVLLSKRSKGKSPVLERKRMSKHNLTG